MDPTDNDMRCSLYVEMRTHFSIYSWILCCSWSAITRRLSLSKKKKLLSHIQTPPSRNRAASVCLGFTTSCSFVMAHLIRSAKSGSDWSKNELPSYNITVQCQDIINFFGHELGSINYLDSNLLCSADPTIAIDLSKETYCFLTYLDLALCANSGQESAINDLVKSVLEVTGFDQISMILWMWYDIPLMIVGITSELPDWVCVLFTSIPWSFLLFRRIMWHSPWVTLSLKALQKQLLPFTTTTGSVQTLVFHNLTWWPFHALQWWEHGHSFTKSQLSRSWMTGSPLVNFPLSQQLLDIVLHPPDKWPLKAWKSQITGTSPYSTTMHSMVWWKIARLCSLMAVIKVCEFFLHLHYCMVN